MLQVGSFYDPTSYAPNPNRIEVLDDLNQVIEDWNFCSDIGYVALHTIGVHDKSPGWARKHRDERGAKEPKFFSGDGVTKTKLHIVTKLRMIKFKAACTNIFNK